MHLVAAEAASLLAGHHSGKRAHRLQCAIVLIEELKMERKAGWDLEIHRAIRLDGYCPEDALDAVVLD